MTDTQLGPLFKQLFKQLVRIRQQTDKLGETDKTVVERRNRQIKQKTHSQFTALHQLDDVIEEHISVPLTKATHIV